MQDFVDFRRHLMTCVRTVDAGHQQLVILRLLVTDRCHDGGTHGVVVEHPARGRAAYASTPPLPSVTSNRFGSLRRATGKLRPYRLREFIMERDVLRLAAFATSLPFAFARVGVGQTFRLSSVECRFLHQDALSLVPLTQIGRAHV